MPEPSIFASGRITSTDKLVIELVSLPDSPPAELVLGLVRYLSLCTSKVPCCRRWRSSRSATRR